MLDETIDNEPVCMCVCITNSNYEREDIAFF
jgi:hypothetical protein